MHAQGCDTTSKDQKHSHSQERQPVASSFVADIDAGFVVLASSQRVSTVRSRVARLCCRAVRSNRGKQGPSGDRQNADSNYEDERSGALHTLDSTPVRPRPGCAVTATSCGGQVLQRTSCST
jgi:hypothetical protein